MVRGTVSVFHEVTRFFAAEKGENNESIVFIPREADTKDQFMVISLRPAIFPIVTEKEAKIRSNWIFSDLGTIETLRPFQKSFEK